MRRCEDASSTERLCYSDILLKVCQKGKQVVQSGTRFLGISSIFVIRAKIKDKNEKIE
jgi:hypothetical protein